MRLLPFAIITLIMATAGCAGSMHSTPASVTPMSRTSHFEFPEGFKAPPGYLYVTNEHGYSVYSLPSSHVVRTLFQGTGARENPAVNAKGQVYFANYLGKSQWGVTIFTSGAAKVVRQITRNVFRPNRLAVSPNNDLYVSSPRSVELYPNSKQVKFERLKGVAQALVAFDATGTAYVGQFASVLVYPPGRSKPSRTITNGLFQVIGLAVDSSGDVYVGNERTNSLPCGNVAVFAPGVSAPSYTITDGICSPYDFTLDNKGNLYVANRPSGTGTGNDITVYAPGAQHPTGQINAPDSTATAVDSSDNAYVASDGSIVIFAAGSFKQVGYLSSGGNPVLGLAWGPK